MASPDYPAKGGSHEKRPLRATCPKLVPSGLRGRLYLAGVGLFQKCDHLRKHVIDNEVRSLFTEARIARFEIELAIYLSGIEVPGHTRIRPSCATDATWMPSRVKMAPRLKP